jgi:CMP-N-acetylneuraminic acid synthetase
MITAIIPIKEHSSRVPNKNFRNFNGKPLYKWVIENIVYNVPEIDELIIDTDSEHLKSELEKINYPKIKVLMREDILRGDDTDVNLIIKSRLDNIKNDVIMQTHVTNPILKASSISKAISDYLLNVANGYDSLMGVTEWKKRFYYEGKAVNHNPNELIKTQNLEPLLEENSNIYIFSKQSFNNAGRRVGGKPFLFRMNNLEAMDIDYEEDFILAEKISQENLVK